MNWKRPPPVVVLSGSEHFLRRRELQKAMLAASVTGRAVEHVEGSDTEAVADAMDGSLLMAAPTLVVIDKPADLDAEFVERALEESDGSLTLLLHHRGKIRAGSALEKLCELIPKKHRAAFNRPPQAHKVRDAAVKFVVREAKARGKVIGSDLAEALVGRVGPDFGILHFEVLKAATYLDALGEETVTPSHMRRTMMYGGDAELTPITDAVAAASARKVLREMERFAMNHPGQESQRVFSVCGGVGNAATRWLHAAALDAAGAGEQEVAARMSLHPYIYKRFLLPAGRRWGRQRLSALIRRIAQVEAGVLRGHIAPWVELEAVLVTACRSVSQGG